MNGIRAFLFVGRTINKYQKDYPVLHKEFNEKKEKNAYKYASFVYFSEQAYSEYLHLVENILQVKKFPNDNRKVWITTHNGGKHVGFYENEKWWYNTINSVRKERGTKK